ncbi:MAG: hypothetical protein KKF46_05635 [Nanoarchaeota archaeon]|nr:hypothetical protein [Nanoarchaeota archaeon]MBU1321814.1 hypothetical protein [Nanoarchaeota archaeon]MBU1598261.1 hypothetical protein [Nanoarchaeota archaeon]MBU2441710.1 hypothetical protein [Nanoarchaeota archaeon]
MKKKTLIKIIGGIGILALMSSPLWGNDRYKNHSTQDKKTIENRIDYLEISGSLKAINKSENIDFMINTYIPGIDAVHVYKQCTDDNMHVLNTINKNLNSFYLTNPDPNHYKIFLRGRFVDDPELERIFDVKELIIWEFDKIPRCYPITSEKIQ